MEPSGVDPAARNGRGPVGFFARLARGLLRWARRLRPPATEPSVVVTPPGSAAQPVPAVDNHALDPPPTRRTVRTGPPLVAEPVPCVVGDPYLDWSLPRPPVAAARPSPSAPLGTVISFPPARPTPLPHQEMALVASGAPAGPATGLKTPGAAMAPGPGPATGAPWTEAVATPTVWTVSVVLVAADRPDGLRRPVGSVLGQSYGGWELLVVETGDGPPPTITPHDPRIRVVTAPGTTTAAGRLRGLEAATGEIIAHLDEHSLMGPDWLSAVVANLVAAPADVVVGAGPTGADVAVAGRAGWGHPGVIAHRRHVPLEAIHWLLSPGDPGVTTCVPCVSVRRLGVAAELRPGAPDAIALATPETRPVIDLTGEPVSPLVMAGR